MHLMNIKVIKMKMWLHFIILSLFSLSVQADNIFGEITKVYGEENGFTVILNNPNKPHPCGGSFYTAISNNDAYLSRMMSIATTALVTQRVAEIFFDGCHQGRGQITGIAIEKDSI